MSERGRLTFYFQEYPVSHRTCVHKVQSHSCRTGYTTWDLHPMLHYFSKQMPDHRHLFRPTYVNMSV